MQNNYNNQVTFGGFFVRLAAYLLDSIIVGIGLLFIRIPLAGMFTALPAALSGGVIFSYTLKDIILYLCGVAYFIILTYCTGTTLGKRALNLRVVNKNREKLSFVTVVCRETIGRFLCGLTIGIGYFIVGLDRNKQGLHDIINDTYVIYEKQVRVRPIPAKRPPMPQPMYQTPQGQAVRDVTTGNQTTGNQISGNQTAGDPIIEGNTTGEGNFQNEQRGL